ncbi:ATPC1 [Auxenochlorella protothecoides x Auxenochlorella symbiontica]
MEALSGTRASFAGATHAFTARKLPGTCRRISLQVRNAGTREIRDRISSVKNTQKITEAMKLVAAAKVRRAQDAVVRGRPFAENLVKVLYGVNQRLRVEDIDSPLVENRPVKTVLLLCVTGDRGLCGGYNAIVIKKTEARYNELTKLGVKVRLLLIGKKGSAAFKRRPNYKNAIGNVYDMGQAPSVKEAQVVADEIFSDFVSQEVDKVEIIYTKFVSLIASEPVVQTLLPLSPIGEVCDVDGNCVDAAEDEVFKLTTREGQLVVESEKTAKTDPSDFEAGLIFEQDPVQIVDALLPLYLNSTLLRSLQEALASELAARMNAMSSASDNAAELRKGLNQVYNRKRQAKITTELSEIVAGASSV